MQIEYVAYLVNIDRTKEIHVGVFKKLSPALVNAKCAMRENGKESWDWVVDKIYEDSSIIQRRSSVGGFESL